MKKLITAALAAASVAAVALAGAAPTQAREIKTRCYFETSQQALGQGRSFGCWVYRQSNELGIVYRVTWEDSVRSSYVFWNDGRVEIFSSNKQHWGRWSRTTIDNRGHAVIAHDSGAVTIFPVF